MECVPPAVSSAGACAASPEADAFSFRHLDLEHVPEASGRDARFDVIFGTNFVHRGFVATLQRLLPYLKPGELLAAERGEAPWSQPAFEQYWLRAQADSFSLRD